MPFQHVLCAGRRKITAAPRTDAPAAGMKAVPPAERWKARFSRAQAFPATAPSAQEALELSCRSKIHNDKVR